MQTLMLTKSPLLRATLHPAPSNWYLHCVQLSFLVAGAASEKILLTYFTVSSYNIF